MTGLCRCAMSAVLTQRNGVSPPPLSLLALSPLLLLLFEVLTKRQCTCTPTSVVEICALRPDHPHMHTVLHADVRLYSFFLSYLCICVHAWVCECVCSHVMCLSRLSAHVVGVAFSFLW